MTVRAEKQITLVRVTDGDDGTPIVWKGSLASAPSNPVVDWCYRNTTDGKVYIYNDSAWVLMTQDGEQGPQGISINSTTTYYQLAPESPTPSAPSQGTMPSSEWKSEEPKYEPTTSYVAVSDSTTPAFNGDEFYAYDSELDDYIRVFEEPSNWATNYTSYYRKSSGDVMWYCNQYIWSDDRITYSIVSRSRVFETAKEAYDYALVTDTSLSNLISESNEIINTNVDDIAALQTGAANAQEDINALEENSAQELVKKGYAKITAEPSLELGKISSSWKVKITNAAIKLQKNNSDVAYLSQDSVNVNETVLKADNAQLSNIKLRSADGQGTLGIVAKSNGHISLKEI